MRRTWRLGAWAALGGVLLLVFVLLACGKDFASGASLPPPPVNASVVDAVIGPEGGTLTHPSGAQLVVPAGALVAPTRLTLNGASAPSRDVLSAEPLGQTIQAGPEGLGFMKPVDVIVPFDPTRLSSGEDTRNVQIRMAPRGTTSFAALQSIVDLTARTVRAKTIHFADFIPAVNPNPVFITTDPTLPQATVSVPYTQALAATGGTAPYTWSLSAGSGLPPGLGLAATGALSGSPTVPNAFGFFVTATDSASHAVQMAFALTVVPSSNPVPVLTQIAPASAAQGSAATAITLTGSSFVPTSQALWDGTPLATAFASATSLGASIPASALVNAGTHQVSVSSPAPGGGTSASLTFTVTPAAQNPAPSISSVSPTTLPVSSVDTQIAIVGAGFIPSSSAVIGAQGIPTTYVSATQLNATIPASYLANAGTLQIGVYNPPPGGGFSAQTIPITVGSLNPVPTLTALSPSSIAAGASDFTLSATGTGFVIGGQLFFGSTALATTIASATSASATVPAALVASPGTVQVTFVNPIPGGGPSGSLAFTVNDVSDGGSDGSDGASDCILPGQDAAAATLNGNYYITTAADVAAIANVTWIVEGLTIFNTTDLTDVALPNLRCAGSITIQSNTALTSVALPSLRAIFGPAAGLFASDNPRLTSLPLPSLQTVNGRLVLGPDVPLASVSLPSLTTVTNDLVIALGPSLTSVSAPVLARVGSAGSGLALDRNTALTSVSFPALTSAGGITLTNCYALASASFPLLTTIDGPVDVENTALSALDLSKVPQVSQLTLRNDAALASLQIPALGAVGSDFDVENCPSLTLIAAPKLGSVGTLSVSNNAALASLSFPVLATSHESAGGTVYIGQNDVLASLSLPMLAAADTLQIGPHRALATVSLPALTNVRGDFAVQSGTSLTTLSVPLLASIGSNLYVQNDPALTALEFPALVQLGAPTGAARLWVEHNGSLALLSAPLLMNTWSGLNVVVFAVDDNPALPQCQVKMLETQLQRLSLVNDSGNNTAATCAPPTLTAISPSSVVAGSADFTLTATGTGFVARGQILFGGAKALPTTVTSGTTANATVPAALVASAGTVQVAFANAGFGGTSGPLPFTVIDASRGLTCSQVISGVTHTVALQAQVELYEVGLTPPQARYWLYLTASPPDPAVCLPGFMISLMMYVPNPPTYFYDPYAAGGPGSVRVSVAGLQILDDGNIAGASGDVVGTVTWAAGAPCGTTICSGTTTVVKK